MDRQSFTIFFDNYKNKDINELYLMESFKDAQRIFSQQADPKEVQNVLGDFKDLAKQGKLQGDDKDITKWMKRPFDQLKSTVNIAKQTPSKKEEKRNIGNDAKKVYDYGPWVVIMPLTKEASCKYGSGTKWCTAATNSENFFSHYFNENNITLLYFINKRDNKKFAAALYSTGQAEFFDSSDKSLIEYDFLKNVNLSKTNFEKIIDNLPDINDHPIARPKDKKMLYQKLERQSSKFDEIVQNVIDYPDLIKKWDDHRLRKYENDIDEFNETLDTQSFYSYDSDEYRKLSKSSNRFYLLRRIAGNITAALHPDSSITDRNDYLMLAKRLAKDDDGLTHIVDHYLNNDEDQRKIDNLANQYKNLVANQQNILNLSSEDIDKIDTEISSITDGPVSSSTAKLISKFDAMIDLLQRINKIKQNPSYFTKHMMSQWEQIYPEFKPLIDMTINKWVK